jgi:Cupin superfamily protein
LDFLELYRPEFSSSPGTLETDNLSYARGVVESDEGQFVCAGVPACATLRESVIRSSCHADFWMGTLDQLLTRAPPDVSVVARGKLLELPTPKRLCEALDLPSGVGLVIRRAEKLEEGIAGLTASVTQHIPGEEHVQLIVTPAATYGFGWHYDDEDVFIVQTEGAKDYFFRDKRLGGNGRTARRPISLDSAMKSRRWALLGCWR